ncbi:MAG: hypothetical protein H0V17_04935 [Deltaproteobacteria bacterium]|nr:hypothetical protein [Deltaproteobacteria bacterium]
MKLLVIVALLGCSKPATSRDTGSATPPAPVVEDRDAKLFGPTPASLGTAFAGITLGGPVKIGDASRIAKAIGDVKIELEPGPRGIRAIEIEHTGTCVALRERLARAWKAATNQAWLDPKTHLRAWFVDAEGDSCHLRFDRYLEPEAWLAAIPMNLVGGDSKLLLERLGPDAMTGDDNIKWVQPGVGYGGSETTLEADLEGRTITQITASTQTDPATTKAIAALLAKRAGSEPTVVVEDKTTKREWKAKPQSLFSTADYIWAGNDFFTLFVNR